jgi:hypothetical protein
MLNTVLLKIPMAHITEIEKINLKIHLEAQKTVSGQDNTVQKEKRWRNHNTRLQTVLHSHNNKKQHSAGTKTDVKTSGTE